MCVYTVSSCCRTNLLFQLYQIPIETFINDCVLCATATSPSSHGISTPSFCKFCLALTHTHSLARMHAHMHARMHARTHARTHAHTQTNIIIYGHAHTHMYTQTHTCMHGYTHIYHTFVLFCVASMFDLHTEAMLYFATPFYII